MLDLCLFYDYSYVCFSPIVNFVHGHHRHTNTRTHTTPSILQPVLIQLNLCGLHACPLKSDMASFISAQSVWFSLWLAECLSSSAFLPLPCHSSAHPSDIPDSFCQNQRMKWFCFIWGWNNQKDDLLISVFYFTSIYAADAMHIYICGATPSEFKVELRSVWWKLADRCQNKCFNASLIW